MIDVILISHGTFAVGLREAAEMIMGDQEQLTVLGLYPGETKEVFAEKLERVIDSCSSPGNVLVLADLQGGTPYNVAIMMVLKRGITCIAGANLAMLLEVLSARDESGMEELVSLAVETGGKGIVDSISLQKRTDI
ncbi:MAG: PTS sugar transporter subunit IIA [Lachnospiraceae bacterium]|nr:PTS sugar transporter subunit IIA [Lachnospiraceae bacterium]